MPATGKVAMLALGGLGLLLLGGAAGASAATSGGSGNPCIDDDMPPDMQATVRRLLSEKKLPPADYDQAADAAELGGYPLAAACLRKKADEREAELALTVAEKGGMPFQIRYGDIPYLMAQYYTGDGQRFRELGAPLNPQVGPLMTVQGVTNFKNWRPGLAILIPEEWDPLSKPLPAPAQGGGGGAAPEETDSSEYEGPANTEDWEAPYDGGGGNPEVPNQSDGSSIWDTFGF